MCVEKLRGQLDRFAMRGNCLILAALSREGDAEAIVITRRGWIHRNRAADEIDRFVRLPAHHRDDAEKMQGIGLIGMLSQDRAVNLCCLG